MKKLFLAFAIAATAFAAPVKNFPLVNQEGRPFQLHDLKGSYVLVTFVYSRCPLPKMCPLSLKLTRQVLEAWKKDPQLKGKKLIALAVTLDPDNDTPAALKAYGKRFSITLPQGIMATGDAKVLAELAGEFNVLGFPEKGSIAHNSKHILLDPSLEPVKEFKDNEWKISDVLEAATKVPTPKS
jgi:protein SCO1/2